MLWRKALVTRGKSIAAAADARAQAALHCSIHCWVASSSWLSLALVVATHNNNSSCMQSAICADSWEEGLERGGDCAGESRGWGGQGQGWQGWQGMQRKTSESMSKRCPAMFGWLTDCLPTSAFDTFTRPIPNLSHVHAQPQPPLPLARPTH